MNAHRPVQRYIGELLAGKTGLRGKTSNRPARQRRTAASASSTSNRPVPVFLGSKNEVAVVTTYHAK